MDILFAILFFIFAKVKKQPTSKAFLYAIIGFGIGFILGSIINYFLNKKQLDELKNMNQAQANNLAALICSNEKTIGEYNNGIGHGLDIMNLQQEIDEAKAVLAYAGYTTNGCLAMKV